MNPDRPVSTLEGDDFNYHPLAKQLAPHLLLKPEDSSLVAGVEAPWGTGKTSFLNLTRLAIKEINPEAIVLDYCPWVYSTTDSLILGFCIQLASQFQKTQSSNYEHISDTLVGFSRAIKPLGLIPGISAVATAAGMALESAADSMKSAAELSKFDISNAKERVQQALKGAGKPVIIFVDDVDRLLPSDVRLLFQFLKAVADFNGVSYVLAYDPTPVEKALSNDGTLDGKEFLKKFVQLPIRLPRLSRLLMRKFLAQTIEQLSTVFTPAIEEAQLRDLKSFATNNLVLSCLKTPRDAVRCFNLFRLRLPDCYGEINLAELLKFVLLDLLCPEAIELVRKHPEHFIGAFSSHPEFADSSAASLDSLYSANHDMLAKKKELLATLPSAHVEIASNLLSSLFPSTQYTSDIDVRTARSVPGLIKLLYGGSSPLAFSVKDATAFLQGVDRLGTVDSMLNDGVFKEWLIFLTSVTPGSIVSDPVGLAECLIDASGQCSSGTFIYDQAEWFISEYLFEVLRILTDPEEAFVYVHAIISHGENLLLSHNLMVSLASAVGLWEAGISYGLNELRRVSGTPLCLPARKVLELESTWLDRVRDCAKEDRLHEQSGLGNLLFRWGQFPDNDYTEPTEYIQSFCKRRDALELTKQIGMSGDRAWMDKLFCDYEILLESLSRYDTEPELRFRTVALVKSLQPPTVDAPTASATR